MPEISVSVDVDVECSECGNGLTVEVSEHWQKRIVCVEPCVTCGKSKHTAGYDKGYDDGYEDGKKEA